MPEGWAWCRLGNLISIKSGDAIKVRQNQQGRIPVYGGNGITGYCSEYNIEIPTIIIGRVGFNCGSVHLSEEKAWATDNAFITTFNHEILNINFLSQLLIFLNLRNYSNSTAQPVISGKTIYPILFPLPPYSEQERIVQTINEAFCKIDFLEDNQNDLQTAIKQAKNKILDLAIHGKLVPQDPKDEPAEELLKRIATSDNRPYKKFDDEVPFDIPKSWSWCTLGEIYTHTTGKALKKTNNKGTLRKYITTSNLYWNSFDFTEVREMYFTDDELEKCTIKKGDLILCNGGDVGRAAIWNYDYDICYQNHVSRLRPKNENINNSFFLYLMMIYKQQGMLNGKGVGITSLSASDLLSAVIPLPPYSEQQRIVSKIEELFSYLDTISSNLE